MRFRIPTSRLGLLNFLILQWFFIRLAKTVATNLGGKPVTIYWMLLGPVVPLTGWWSDYKTLGKFRHCHLRTVKNA